MKRQWTVWAFSVACFFLLLPCTVHGQQGTQLHWQGPVPPPSSLQSPTPSGSSQKPRTLNEQRPASDHRQPPSASDEQASQQSGQAEQPGAQETPEPGAQLEIPAVWLPAPPATSTPGYLGLSGRDFYHARFCMHAMTIQGVEVAAVAPDSPAARAGLRPGQPLSAREVAVATAAGLLTMSPAAPLAAPFVRASGGVNHGDIILAVSGKRVTTQNEFQRALARFGPHTVVYLTVRRGEAVLQIPVRLDDWPAPASPSPLEQARVLESH
ncbi:MAG: PDZ domain-containing protein [Deltaproteobacteria bacterium]|nr:PDZ domain-containing protein [Deltaproteobacteria bacterium]